jgi:hypothetical protein
MAQRQPRGKTTLAILGLDLVLTGSMLALFSVNLTGLRLHEWLGLGLCILLPTHLMVNWNWLAATTRLVLGPLPWRVRARYLLNASLFASIVVVTLSGLLISEALFPGLATAAGNAGLWHSVHTLTSNLTLVLLGLHLGVYWRNITTMLRRILPGARGSAAGGAQASLASSRMGA